MKKILLLASTILLTAFDFGHKVGTPQYMEVRSVVYRASTNIGHLKVAINTGEGFYVKLSSIPEEQLVSPTFVLQPQAITSGVTVSTLIGKVQSQSQPDQDQPIQIDMSEINPLIDVLQHYKQEMVFTQQAVIVDKKGGYIKSLGH